MQVNERIKDIAEAASEKVQSLDNAVERTGESLPTNLFLLGAAASIGIALTLKVLGRDRDAEFVGHWAPTFIGLGLLKKLFEHDHREQNRWR